MRAIGVTLAVAVIVVVGLLVALGIVGTLVRWNHWAWGL